MKAGNYTVRGTIGPGKSAPIMAHVYESDGSWFVDFEYDGVHCTYRPRRLSPHPERIMPVRLLLLVQPTCQSIAREAFKVAREAATEDARQADIVRREAEQDGASVEDIALGGIARRSMGVAQ